MHYNTAVDMGLKIQPLLDDEDFTVTKEMLQEFKEARHVLIQHEDYDDSDEETLDEYKAIQNLQKAIQIGEKQLGEKK